MRGITERTPSLIARVTRRALDHPRHLCHESNVDVLISGAGIAGPTLVWWLARRGVRPVIVERAPALRSGGHAIDIRGVAIDVVEQMGLLAEIQAARTHLHTLS